MNNEKIITGYINHEEEKELRELANANNTEAKRKGAFTAKSNNPPLDALSLEPYIAPFKTSYEEHRAKRLGILKPEVAEMKFKKFSLEKNKREAIIDAKIKALQHAIDLEQHNLNGKQKPELKKSNPIAIALLCIMYLSEFLLNALAFEFLGGNPLFAYLIGAGVTVLCGALCFAIGKNLSRIENGEKPYVQLGIQTLTAIGLVVAMSIIRTQMLAGSQVQIAPWVFFCINIAFLIGTVYFSRLFFPSQKLADEKKELLAQHETIEKNEAEIKVLEAEKKLLEEEYKKEEEKYLFIVSDAHNMCLRIDAHYQETVALFKAENIISRPDKGTPQCFLLAIPELKPVSLPNPPQS